jgi:peptidoglycan/LPS O-acetylase OafA/YrhL
LKTPDSKGFYFALEGIRGIAAILVAIRHLAFIYIPVESPTSFLAVDLFFILSGFVLAANYERKLRDRSLTPQAFFTLRIIRIYPLYIIGSMIGCAVLTLDPAVSSASLAGFAARAVVFVPQMDRSLPVYPLDHPAWSLFAELAMCGVYGLWLARASNRIVALVGAVSGCLLLFGIVHTGSADIGYQQSLFVFGLVRIGFSFSVGVLIFRRFAARSTAVRHIGNLGTALVLIAAGAFLLAPVRQGTTASIAYSTLAVFIAFPALIALAVRCQPTGVVRFLSVWLGKLSFPLYVFHVPVGTAMSAAALALTGREITALAAWIAPAAFLAIAALSLVADAFVDIPIRRYLRERLVGGRRRPLPT